MKLSERGLMALIAHEGIVQSKYYDSVGVATIGVGHTKAAGGINPETFTGKLTIAEVFDLLRADVAKYEASVSRAVKVPVEQHQFDALVSFHYNTGAIAKASLVKKLNAGDFEGAAAGFDAWVKPPEIKPRRMAEKALFKSGTYPEPFATIYPASPQGKVLWNSGKRVDLRKELGVSTVSPQIPSPEPVPAPPEVFGNSGLLGAIIKFILSIIGAKK